mmetsp:Transcript_18694/g.72125  ORF Transcript_18694/g.72125 Transcript_18694/m.72125 type:complete len:225 (+) Transcript_18694:1987-2661(+)
MQIGGVEEVLARAQEVDQLVAGNEDGIEEVGGAARVENAANEVAVLHVEAQAVDGVQCHGVVVVHPRHEVVQETLAAAQQVAQVELRPLLEDLQHSPREDAEDLRVHVVQLLRKLRHRLAGARDATEVDDALLYEDERVLASNHRPKGVVVALHEGDERLQHAAEAGQAVLVSVARVDRLSCVAEDEDVLLVLLPRRIVGFLVCILPVVWAATRRRKLATHLRY